MYLDKARNRLLYFLLSSFSCGEQRNPIKLRPGVTFACRRLAVGPAERQGGVFGWDF